MNSESYEKNRNKSVALFITLLYNNLLLHIELYIYAKIYLGELIKC